MELAGERPWCCAVLQLIDTDQRLMLNVNILRLCCGTRWRRRNRLLRGEPANDTVKDGREEDAEDRHTQHAAEYGNAQRHAHFSASALAQNQWDDTEDECEGC